MKSCYLSRALYPAHNDLRRRFLTKCSTIAPTNKRERSLALINDMFLNGVMSVSLANALLNQ